MLYERGYHFLLSQSVKGRYQNLFAKLVRMDMIGIFWRPTTRELYHTILNRLISTGPGKRGDLRVYPHRAKENAKAIFAFAFTLSQYPHLNPLNPSKRIAFAFPAMDPGAISPFVAFAFTLCVWALRPRIRHRKCLFLLLSKILFLKFSPISLKLNEIYHICLNIFQGILFSSRFYLLD